MARTESIQSDFSRAPDERPREPSSFDRIESLPDFVKTASDLNTLYPPRRPFVSPSPLSSSSEVTLSPVEVTTEKGVYLKNRPPTLRLASGSSVPMIRDPSKRYSGYSSPESTANFALDERLEPERSPTVVETPFPINFKKEPQLSWTLTVLLLVLVTAVRPCVVLGERLSIIE